VPIHDDRHLFELLCLEDAQAGEAKFVCMDGPEFDGHKVDFDGMLARMRVYREQEHQALADYQTTAAGSDWISRIPGRR